MKINPRQMEKMAKKLGMQMTEIPAEEVIIRTQEKDIIIREPNVSKVNMMGQETFQITGQVSEEAKEGFSDADIQMIVDQTGATEAEAMATLEETGDIAEAIMKLKKEKEQPRA